MTIFCSYRQTWSPDYECAKLVTLLLKACDNRTYLDIPLEVELDVGLAVRNADWIKVRDTQVVCQDSARSRTQSVDSIVPCRFLPLQKVILLAMNDWYTCSALQK